MVWIALACILGALWPTGSTPLAIPEATPVVSAAGWQVTNVREIEVDGEAFALSPDGQWLAGTADDGNAVCAWDVERLAPTCAEVSAPVRPIPGSMALRWAPDSLAFAFVSGDAAVLTPGNVFVFEVETGELVNLTGADGAVGGDPMYLGADWTADGSQVVYSALHAFRDQSEPGMLYRIDRNGGEPVEIPLPGWFGQYNIPYPPLVSGDAVLVTIESEGDAGGVWRVGLDGSDPARLVAASGPNEVPDPFVVSVSPDGRHANVVSMSRMSVLEPEETYFIVDLISGELVSLVFADGLGLVTFSPWGDTGLTVRDERLATVDAAYGATQSVANSPETHVWLIGIPVWAENDTVFLPGDGGTLVTLAPAT